MKSTIQQYLTSNGIHLTPEQYKKIIVYNLGHKIAKEYKSKGLTPERRTEECNGIEVYINYYDWSACREAAEILNIHFKISSLIQ